MPPEQLQEVPVGLHFSKCGNKGSCEQSSQVQPCGLEPLEPLAVGKDPRCVNTSQIKETGVSSGKKLLDLS